MLQVHDNETFSWSLISPARSINIYFFLYALKMYTSHQNQKHGKNHFVVTYSKLKFLN